MRLSVEELDRHWLAATKLDDVDPLARQIIREVVEASEIEGKPGQLDGERAWQSMMRLAMDCAAFGLRLRAAARTRPGKGVRR